MSQRPAEITVRVITRTAQFWIVMAIYVAVGGFLILADPLWGLLVVPALTAVAASLLVPCVTVSRDELRLRSLLRTVRLRRHDIRGFDAAEEVHATPHLLLGFTAFPIHQSLEVQRKDGALVESSFIVARPLTIRRLMHALTQWRKTGDTAAVGRV